MSENDPMVLAARRVLASALTAIRRCVATSPTEALNWKQPGGDDTSSIAVLAVHSLASTRGWLAQSPQPRRDRIEIARMSSRWWRRTRSQCW